MLLPLIYHLGSTTLLSSHNGRQGGRQSLTLRWKLSPVHHSGKNVPQLLSVCEEVRVLLPLIGGVVRDGRG